MFMLFGGLVGFGGLSVYVVGLVFLIFVSSFGAVIFLNISKQILPN